MGKNGTLHSKPSPLMQGDTVKDPPLLSKQTIVHLYNADLIMETSIRYRCIKCGKFVNPGYEEVFMEHTHCGR